MKYQELKVGGYYKVVSSEKGRKYLGEVPVGTVFQLCQKIPGEKNRHEVVMFSCVCPTCKKYEKRFSIWDFYRNEQFEHLIPSEIAKYEKV